MKATIMSHGVQIQGFFHAFLATSLMQDSHIGHHPEVAKAHSAASKKILAVLTVRNLNAC